MTDGETAPLSLHSLPPPLVEPLRDASVMPIAPGAGLASGVFRADGSFCALSRTRLTDNRFTAIPAPRGTRDTGPLPGTYLFGGIGRHHFGHFLLETIARLWALDGRQGQIRGLILLPMPQTDFGAVLRRRMLAFFQIMGCDIPLHLVKTPVRVQHLLLPSQGIGHAEWAVGTKEFRRLVRHRIVRTCPAIGPGKLYISRARLRHRHQHIDQEERIEKLMKSAGYAIFHPQRHSVRAQCQAYRAAHTIVGGDGSAFHLAPFAMQPETRIGLIERRDRADVTEAIVNQIKAFVPVDLVVLNALKRGQETAEASAPISFRTLKRQLEKARLI